MMKLVDLLPREAWTPAKADAPERVAALERRLGHELPPDLKELHLTCANVSLDDSGHAFLTPEEIDSIGALQLGDPTGDSAPRTWIGAIDCLNGSYVGVDLVPNVDGTYNWLDCDHETVGDVAVIATSLAELLQRMLAHRDGSYWLAARAGPFRRIVYERPPSFYRKMAAGWYGRLGDEVGPETCTASNCTRLRIELSVKCRRHHYEMMWERPSPFDDD